MSDARGGEWDPRIVPAGDGGSTALDLREASLMEASVAMVGLVVAAREHALRLLHDAEEQAAAIVARAEVEAAAVFETARARIDTEVQAAEARLHGQGSGNGRGVP